MRFLFVKILIWSLATFALAYLTWWGVSRALAYWNPPPVNPFNRIIPMIEEEVCNAYEEGGVQGLQAQLRLIDDYVPGKHLLTDAQGRDLATGTDKSDLLQPGIKPSAPKILRDGRMVLVGRPRGGRYRFIAIVEPWPEPPGSAPYFGAVMLVIALLAAGLTVYLVAPLLKMRSVVDAFGQGDLNARIESARKDEIGQLGRAFDEMAGRIETLLAAERRLLQDVSHELRSPLARLGFAVELARTSDDRGAALDRIQRDVGRLNHLVDELLQLTRIEGDPASLKTESVEIDELLREIVGDCEMEAAVKGCRLALATVPAVVQGEWELLRRAVENVLRNAVRHAPEQTVIDVSLKRNGGMVTLSVRDRGEGVPDALLGEIFKPFFRVEGDRSRTSGGTGLGLSIAHRAMTLQHGQITARNALPGLLVSIELPDGWRPESEQPDHLHP